jgi:hypothetical protein
MISKLNWKVIYYSPFQTQSHLSRGIKQRISFLTVNCMKLRPEGERINTMRAKPKGATGSAMEEINDDDVFLQMYSPLYLSDVN